MATLSEALALAIQHHQSDRLQAAERIYRQILRVEPDHADVIHLLGLIAHQRGQHEIAIETIQRAIRLKANDFVFHNNLGEAFSASGRVCEAMACYRRALDLNPDLAEAHNNLGNSFSKQGKPDEAAACYRRALELKPADAQTHFNLGIAFFDQGKPDEAVACYRRALELKPDFAEAHYNLGNAFYSQQSLDEAAACYRGALALKPNFAKAHGDLGLTLNQLGKLDEAVACYRRALELQPDSAEIQGNLGLVFKNMKRPDEAAACFRRALDLKPDFAEMQNSLGVVLMDQGKLDDAAACFRQAIEIMPEYAEAHNNLGAVFKDQGRLDEALAACRHAAGLRPQSPQYQSNVLFTLLFHRDSKPALLAEEHRHWNQRHALPLSRSIRPHVNDFSPERRLRVGYVSPDFRQHAQAFFTVPLFSAHDHDNFEIVCYSDVMRADEITAKLRGYADVWRSITGQSDQHAAEMIWRDQIDVLVDLTMHMAGNRLLVFARRPAPVQVTWLAYPGSTGLTAIDYRLTDSYLDPPDVSGGAPEAADYSEESIRLPDTFWCYDPLTQEPAVNPLPAVAAGHVTFGCLNNFCKVNADVLKLWAQVMKVVDRSRLVLLAATGAHRQQTLDLLEREGVAKHRVSFVEYQPRLQYLQLYHGIDVVLDTFPYNGHTTSLDALWMGVPVVTLVGQTVVSRAGLSQLMNLGLPGLVARTPEQFVGIAANLATNLNRLATLRASLRERLEQSPLMDASRFARGMEAAYRALWRRACERPQDQ